VNKMQVTALLVFITIQDEAQLWSNHGSRLINVHPAIAVWCYSAALHLAAGDDYFQSEIYCIRALKLYDLGDQAKCEEDIKECKRLNIELTLVSFSL
jgi:hypothetical protein